MMNFRIAAMRRGIHCLFRRATHLRWRLLSLLLLCIVMRAQHGITQAGNISFSAQNETLEHVFERLHRATGYDFVYLPNPLKGKKPVTFEVKDVNMQILMGICLLGRDLDFKIDKKTIVITPKLSSRDSVPIVPARDSLIELSGRVIGGADGLPLPSATIVEKAGGNGTTADINGYFRLSIPKGRKVVISYVGFKPKEVRIAEGQAGGLTIHLDADERDLAAVDVVSSGFQKIPKERATGSFVQLDERILNRRVGTGIIDRLEGITSGLIFNRNIQTGENESPFSIRGRSTIFANTKPLIIIDNFPYEGDLANINPSDVASITVLKDAAAASIWGARSGNGVIVITTKSGKRNAAPRVSVTSNITFGERPDLDYHPIMSNSEYIAVEKILFDRGYFNGRLNSKPKGILSPAVEVFAKERSGEISSSQAQEQLDELARHELRNGLEKYYYRHSLNQQYNVNISGGGLASTYYVSAGYDHNKNPEERDDYGRYSFNARHAAYFLNDRLEVQTSLNLVSSISRNNNAGGPNPSYPYARLADENGNALPVVGLGFNPSYIDTAGQGLLLVWFHRPLDELRFSDSKTSLNDYRIGTNISFKVIEPVKISVIYQYNNGNSQTRNLQSLATYNTRNLINLYTQIDYNRMVVTKYPIPMGGILDIRNGRYAAHNIRTQLDFHKKIGAQHELSTLVGWELMDYRSTVSSSRLYGYDERNATNIPIDYTNTYPARPAGIGRLLASNNVSDSYSINRYISLYGNFSYTFKDRYVLSGSARKDESNLFGVDANQRGVPLWSGGLLWHLDREDFYHSGLFPSLKLRATYGYNGNIDRSVSAYTTARSTSTNRYGALQFEVMNPPNPNLRWETIATFNLGVDFRMKNDVLTGSVEYFRKSGRDLIGFIPKAASSGVALFKGNNANLQTTGVDVIINSNNIHKAFKWSTTLLFSYAKDKVTKFLAKPGTLATFVTNTFAYPYEGRPYNSIFALRWAGLDPENGNPMGYVNGEPSSDYSRLRGIQSDDELIYMGTGRPLIFGALRNDFEYKGISLSINLTYKLKYVFRRQSVNYSGLVVLFGGQAVQPDYERRWQQKGDEAFTDVPSFIYPANINRDLFYHDSEHLVEDASHIRLQDIRLGYDLGRLLPQKAFKGAQIYAYANNLGIAWKATKHYVDPDYPTASASSYIPPRTFAIGTVINF